MSDSISATAVYIVCFLDFSMMSKALLASAADRNRNSTLAIGGDRNDNVALCRLVYELPTCVVTCEYGST
jgi:hypothetical protein